MMRLHIQVPTQPQATWSFGGRTTAEGGGLPASDVMGRLECSQGGWPISFGCGGGDDGWASETTAV